MKISPKQKKLKNGKSSLFLEFYNGYQINKNGEVTFLDYYEPLKGGRFEIKVNYGNWDAAQKHIEKYYPAHKQLKDIDTDFVKGFEQGESTREYLTYSELQVLTQAECKYPVLKNAFIFSCLTGLR